MQELPEISAKIKNKQKKVCIIKNKVLPLQKIKDMKNNKFYYISDEHEPKILFLDTEKREAYLFDELDLTNVEIIEYPTEEDLRGVIAYSMLDGFSGDWDDMKYIFDNSIIVEGLVRSEDRLKYINNLSSDSIKYTTLNLAEDRFWRRFKNQTLEIGKKHLALYDKGIKYLKTLSEETLKDFDSLSNEEFFDKILSEIKPAKKVDKNHFSF